MHSNIMKMHWSFIGRTSPPQVCQQALALVHLERTTFAPEEPIFPLPVLQHPMLPLRTKNSSRVARSADRVVPEYHSAVASCTIFIPQGRHVTGLFASFGEGGVGCRTMRSAFAILFLQIEPRDAKLSSNAAASRAFVSSR